MNTDRASGNCLAATFRGEQRVISDRGTEEILEASAAVFVVAGSAGCIVKLKVILAGGTLDVWGPSCDLP